MQLQTTGSSCSSSTPSLLGRHQQQKGHAQQVEPDDLHASRRVDSCRRLGARRKRGPMGRIATYFLTYGRPEKLAIIIILPTTSLIYLYCRSSSGALEMIIRVVEKIPFDSRLPPTDATDGDLEPEELPRFPRRHRRSRRRRRRPTIAIVVMIAASSIGHRRHGSPRIELHALIIFQP
jgi:hypothetical protein